MVDSTSSKEWVRLLRDTSISSRALAFAYALWLLADDKPKVRLERREVEAWTRMKHLRWPEAEAAKRLGVVLIDRGSSHWSGEFGMAGTWQVSQFGPTSVTARISASVQEEVAVSGSVLPRGGRLLYHSGGTELGLAHPANVVWDVFGQQRYDAWRLDSLVGARDVLVTADDLGWMKRSAAYRFLARARAAHLLVDGLWLGSRVAYLVETLGEDGMYPTKYARAKAAEESARRAEGLSRWAQLDAYLERTQSENLALALERGSQCAITWALEMADPELRRAFAYGGQSQPEVVAW